MRIPYIYILPHLCAMQYFHMVPVRYRPNAASGGWSYGRDLCHCREKGNTRFDSISLNVDKTTGCSTLTSTANYFLLGKAPSHLFYLRYSVEIYMCANSSEPISCDRVVDIKPARSPCGLHKLWPTLAGTCTHSY